MFLKFSDSGTLGILADSHTGSSGTKANQSDRVHHVRFALRSGRPPAPKGCRLWASGRHPASRYYYHRAARHSAKPCRFGTLALVVAALPCRLPLEGRKAFASLVAGGRHETTRLAFAFCQRGGWMAACYPCAASHACGPRPETKEAFEEISRFFDNTSKNRRRNRTTFDIQSQGGKP